MMGMQYKIFLPKDYDMRKIRLRVQENGNKTDGFPGLHFKVYLMSEKNENGSLFNCYAPLYIWKDSRGMNQFIFGGYYDNILESFGWQHIQIGVPLSVQLEQDFAKSKYVVETEGVIHKANSLLNSAFEPFHVDKNKDVLATVLIYNPDQWSYNHYGFYREKPNIVSTSPVTVYEILHVSQ